TVPQARRVARTDLKVALGLLSARHVAGDPDLTERLRAGALEDWRGAAPPPPAGVDAPHHQRARARGGRALPLGPRPKGARGGAAGCAAARPTAAAWRTAWWSRTARWCWPGRPTRPATRRWCCARPPRPRRPGCRWRRGPWTG